MCGKVWYHILKQGMFTSFCLQNQVIYSKWEKYGGTKLYFSPLGMAVYMYSSTLLVKCSVRHAYLVIKSQNVHLSQWISVAALIHLQSLFFSLVMEGYFCFPSLKHYLFHWDASKLSILYKFSRIRKQNFHLFPMMFSTKDQDTCLSSRAITVMLMFKLFINTCSSS